MERLTYFNHYFEIFAGINAAIISIGDIFEMYFSFFWELIKGNLTAHGSKIMSILVNSKETIDIIEAMPQPHEKAPIDSARLASLTEVHEEELIRYSRAIDKEFEDEIDSDKIKIRVIPAFVFCFLYCVFLILLGGFCESYSFIEKWSFVFLAYLNIMVFTLYAVLSLHHEFSRDIISYFHRKFLSKKKHFGENSRGSLRYLKIRRNTAIFFILLFVSGIFTWISSWLVSRGVKLRPVNVPIVLASTFIVCPFPSLLLMNCARTWKNRKLVPIVEEYLLNHKDILEMTENLQQWMDGLDLAQKIRFVDKKLIRKPQKK